MKNARTFLMNGKTYNSMVAIAADLGKKRIYPKDFPKYNITEITNVADVEAEEVDDRVTAEDLEAALLAKAEADEAEETVEAEDTAEEETTEAEAEEVETTEEDTEEDTDEAEDTAEDDAEDEADEAEDTEDESDDDEDDETAEDEVEAVMLQLGAKGYKLAQFAKDIRRWTVDQLLEGIDLIGDEETNRWETIVNEPIRKMRLIMELKAIAFPGEKLPVAGPSQWRGIDLQVLIDLADANDVEYRVVNEDRVQRMWVIKALNDAGITADQLPEEVDDDVDEDEAAPAVSEDEVDDVETTDDEEDVEDEGNED